MNPSEIDALLGVLGKGPSQWTLAKQAEREALEREKRRRKVAKASRRRILKVNGERLEAIAKGKRQRFRKANQGEHARMAQKLERWLGQTKMGRFRPLVEVQRTRAALAAGMTVGQWLGFQDLKAIDGWTRRYWMRDMQWLVDVGVVEVRHVEGRNCFGRGVRQWRKVAEAPLYVPDSNRRRLYDLQEYAEALNG